MVEPAVPTLLEATLVTDRSALDKTLNAAVAVFEFDPTFVVKDPDGMVLVNVPEIELVITVVNVQLAAGATTAPEDNVRVPNPTVADATPAIQLVLAKEVALTSPDGNASVNKAESVADANAWVLVIVMVRSAVPPALIVLGEKAFATVGRARDTASTSAAEQTPLVHDAETFVLLTLAGGLMKATLLTWVCAPTPT